MQNNSGVLWVRVSSDDQAKGYSPDSQERLLESIAAKREIIPVKKFNVTESAKTSENRKLFKEMIEFIKKNEIRNLVALSADRLARNYQDFTTLQILVDKHNVSIILAETNKIINQNSDYSDRFLFQLLASLSEMGNRQRSADTRRGMEQKARQGGAPYYVPIGYLNVVDPQNPKRKFVIVDEERGSLIKKAFELYDTGKYSLFTLADELNRLGLRTRPTKSHSAAPITKSSIEVILKNKFYIGLVLQRGQYYPGAHQPLISKQLFDSVQGRLAQHCSYSRPDSKKVFPFKKFLKCGYCGCQLTGEEQQGKNGNSQYRYYRCTFSKDRNCPQKYYREEEIDKMLTEAMGDLYVDETIAEEIRKRLKSTHLEQSSWEDKERARLQAAETKKTRHLDLIYEDRLNEIITPEQYKQKSNAIQGELAQIKSDINKLGKTNLKYKEEGSTILALLKGLKQTYEKQDYQGKAEILALVLDKVFLRDGKAQFHWKPPFDFLFSINKILEEEEPQAGSFIRSSERDPDSGLKSICSISRKGRFSRGIYPGSPLI
jgi:DNA invertase Pin-like site-specific DNA recombinase